MIYAIHNYDQSSDAIDMDIVSLAEILRPKMPIDTDPLLYLIDMHINNDTLKSFWSDPIEFKYTSYYKTRKVDINILGSLIFFTEKAHKALKKILASYGEFLEIRVEGDRNYLFNPLVFGEEDLLLSERNYFNNMPTNYKNIFFKKEDVDKKTIFKSKLGGALLYCNDNFTDAVKENRITGISFTAIPDYNYKELY